MPSYIVSRYLQNSTGYTMPQVKDGLWMQYVDISLSSEIRDIGFGGYAHLVDYSNIRLFNSLASGLPVTTYKYLASDAALTATPFTCQNNQQIRLSMAGQIECKSGDTMRCLSCSEPDPPVLQPAKPCQTIAPLARGRFIRIAYITPSTQNHLHLREIEVYDVAGAVISRGKPVTMSSVASPLIASNLVDGDYNTIAMTNTNPTPVFIRIDLQAEFDIFGIRIWNRVDFANRLHSTNVMIEGSSNNVVHTASILSTTPHINNVYSFGTPCFLARMSFAYWNATVIPLHNRYTMIPAVRPLQDPKRFLFHFTAQTDGEFSLVMSENGNNPSTSQNYYEIRLGQLVTDIRVLRLSSCRSNSINSCNVLNVTSMPVSLNSTRPQEFWLWYNDGAFAIGTGQLPHIMALGHLSTFTRFSHLSLARDLVVLSAIDANPLTGIRGFGYGGWLNDVFLSEVSIMPMLDEIAPSDVFTCNAPRAITSQAFVLSRSNYFSLEPQPYTSSTGITFSLISGSTGNFESVFGFHRKDYVVSNELVKFEVRIGLNWVDQLTFNMDQIDKSLVRMQPGQLALLDGRTRKADDATAWSVLITFSNGLFRSQSMMCPQVLLNETMPPFFFSNAIPTVATSKSITRTSMTTRSSVPKSTQQLNAEEETFLFLPVSFAYYVYGGAGCFFVLIIAFIIIVRRRNRRKKITNGDFMLAGDVKPSDFNENNLTHALENVLHAPKQNTGYLSATSASFSSAFQNGSSMVFSPPSPLFGTLNPMLVPPPNGLFQTLNPGFNMNPYGPYGNGLSNTANPLLLNYATTQSYSTNPEFRRNA